MLLGALPILFSLALVGPAQRAHTVGSVDSVDTILARLTLEEKVGQLLFVGFGGTVMDGAIGRFLDDKKPGAVALFGRNIKTLPQTLTLVRALHEFRPGGVPTFIAVDQEGGNVVRLREQIVVPPSAMALGATGDEALVEELARALGEDLHTMGFNMNLAPVLDINSNPDNPVIGTRAFGDDPELVATLGTAYVKGLQRAGVSAVAKHFPGHGDTSSDSHHDLPVLQHSRSRLLATELAPFRAAMTGGLDAVMTAHVSLPLIAEEPRIPATVSHIVLTELLRTTLQYDGLVITDGLEMQGIVSLYGSGEAAVRAVLAGADMVMVLWFPERKEEVHRALLDAARSGRISPARLDQSVRRVLEAKMRRGLFLGPPPPLEDALAALAARAPRPLVDEVAEKAITLVRNRGALLPLRGATRALVISSEPQFLSDVRRARPRDTGVTLKAGSRTLGREVERLTKLALTHDVIVMGILEADHADLVAALRRALPNKPMVVVNFGSPYLVRKFEDVDAYLCVFGFRVESERAAAAVVLGKRAPTGRLPVTLPTGERRGTGLSFPVDARADIRQP